MEKAVSIFEVATQHTSTGISSRPLLRIARLLLVQKSASLQHIDVLICTMRNTIHVAEDWRINIPLSHAHRFETFFNYTR